MLSEILIILERPQIADSLRRVIEREGYVVTITSTFFAAKKRMQYRLFDVIICDPYHDRDACIEFLQTIHDIGIDSFVFGISKEVTATQRIEALEEGLDDYLTLPYHPRELLLKLNKFIRRKHSTKKDLINTPNFALNVQSGDLNCPWGKVELRRKEFLILSLLLQQKNRIVPKDYIIDRVWGMEETPTHSTIDVHIRRIRLKLKDTQKKLIKTSYGVGYMFCEE